MEGERSGGGVSGEESPKQFPDMSFLKRSDLFWPIGLKRSGLKRSWPEVIWPQAVWPSRSRPLEGSQ